MNADMNSYSGLRFLEQSNGSIIASISHLPSGVSYGEIQAIILSKNGYGVQILFHSNAGKVYIRSERGLGTFDDWVAWI